MMDKILKKLYEQGQRSFYTITKKEDKVAQAKADILKLLPSKKEIHNIAMENGTLGKKGTYQISLKYEQAKQIASAIVTHFLKPEIYPLGTTGDYTDSKGGVK